MTKKLSLVFLLSLSACNGDPGGKDPNPLHLPPQGFVGDSIKGIALYDQNCQPCHGNNGIGQIRGHLWSTIFTTPDIMQKWHFI